MPGSIRSMHVEHVFRDVQTDRGSLLHGRLLRWQFDTATLAHRMPSGGVHSITQLSRLRRVVRTAGVGHQDALLRPRLSAWSRLGKPTLAATRATGETRRFRPFASPRWNRALDAQGRSV